MNYYGFNSFIFAVYRDDDGLLYDLLKADVYQVPSHFVKIFDKNSYTAYETLLQRISKEGIGEDQLRAFLNEGMTNGTILEFPQPFWRNEIKTPMETGFNSQEKKIPGEYFNVWLQPSGKCDQFCHFCNRYVNCSCVSNDSEWSENELDNLLKDLWRFKGMLLKVSVHGGNPLLYPHFDKMLSGLKQLKPVIIRLVIPFSRNSDLFKNKIQDLKDASESNIIFSFNIYPTHCNVNDLIELIPPGSELNLLIDSNECEKVDDVGLKKGGFKIKKKYLLKSDLSNIAWYKEKINNDFFESLEYNEFFIRKHLHKCWGCSFAINAKGEVKPCLWSDQIFSSWQEGKVSQILIDDIDVSLFYRENNLENIEGCKECIYRYGCKDCRVTAEFLAKARRAKNPLCEKSSPKMEVIRCTT